MSNHDRNTLFVVTGGVLAAMLLGAGLWSLVGTAHAELEVVDPYSSRGWCDVETVEEDVIWNPRTCETWVIRCPAGGGSCKAWPVEFMPTPEPGPEKTDAE